MSYYIGCDVSLKETNICIMDKEGLIIDRKVVLSDDGSIDDYLLSYKSDITIVGIEAGSTSCYLYHELSKRGYKMVCIEAHHARCALSSNPVKNDANDAEGIAHLLRMGWYKVVHVKSYDTQLLKSYVIARDGLKKKIQDIKNMIRGVVKPFCIKFPIGGGSKWSSTVRERLSCDSDYFIMIEPLLCAYDSLCAQLIKYDKYLQAYARNDQVCRRLMTIPGVGVINAVAFKSVIEEPNRIKKTRDVGAYLGLTPKCYSSGEVDRKGHISKCGSSMMRTLLHEAAQILLSRVKSHSQLRSYGLRLCKRKPKKVAITALSRKIAILMLTIWKNGSEFKHTVNV